jgi:superoxide reductase
MCEIRFFRCKHCGNIVGMIESSGVPVICCGEPMEQLVPNSTDAAQEKHVPVVTVAGDKVTVHIGSVDHPMTEQHLIKWVYLQTCCGGHRKCLEPGDKPEVTFALADEKPVAVFAWCNLHGLWVKEL